MSKKKKETFAQLIVGLFMIVVVLLLGYFTIVISGVDILTGDEKVRLSVAFDEVGGLKDHDNVMYRGTKVGSVERVVVTPTNLVVVANVDRHVVLRDGCRITVGKLSMLGGNYLHLDEGTGEAVDLSSRVFRGEAPLDWIRDVSQIAKSMNALVNRPEMREIVTNVAAVTEKTRRIAERVDAVLARIENGEGVVGRLVSTDSKLYDEIEQAAANVNEITERVNRGEGFMGQMLAKDNRLYSDVENTVSNVNEIVSRVRKGEGLAGRMLADDDPIYAEVRASVEAFRKACEAFDMADVKGDVKALAAKGEALIDNLNTVAARIRNGEGTVGKLMKEDGMYSEVEGLIRDCRQIIDNYRDTTPIATFSSLAAGAL